MKHSNLNRSTVAAIAASAVLLLASSFSALAQKAGGKPQPQPVYPYTFTSLGEVGYNNFGGGAKAYGITEPNQDAELLVVGGGTSQPSASFDTIWLATASGGLLSATPLPSSTKGTVAVNDAGMITYYGYSDRQAAYMGLVYVPGVGTVELWPDYRPNALNNLGQVVGSFNGQEGWLLTVGNDGTISDWAWLDDFVPFAINDGGDMAGQQGGAAAIAWFENGVLQVQKLPGLYAGDYGRVTGINNLGEVVGVSTSSGTSSGFLSGYYKPFYWSSVAGLVGLADSGAALDINDLGQVVGWSFNSKGYYAFLWENGKLSDLNILSGVGTKTFQLGTAEAINNAGQIVGRGDTYDKRGASTGAGGSYLLTPSP